MSAISQTVLADLSPDAPAPVVVVGAGPVGVRLAQELQRRSPRVEVLVYGDEPWEPYNRVKLSSLLAGDVDASALENTRGMFQDESRLRYVNARIVSIDREARLVHDARGQTQPYSKLVLATGSRPHIPSIPGIDISGVFTFRDMEDAQRLMARRVRSRRTLILGGGLLGLEAARAMQRFNTEVYVIEHASHLMFHQLDEQGADTLQTHIEALGIKVIVDDGVQQLLGDGALAGVRLRTGREIECDTLVVATGIQPNISLAREAGISVGRGIRVNDQMQTSDPDVYAVGECAEHEERVYGLVAPGLEQAAVAAHNITGSHAEYHGSLAATSLKVVGCPVFSIGEVDEQDLALEHIRYAPAEGREYRKLVVKGGRLQGAVAVGEWPELGRIQEAVTHGRRVWPWQLRRFRKTGLLWPEQEAQSVVVWPAAATVCNCTGVTRGRLSDAIAAGCANVQALAAETGASTVCGSCRPLLVELTGAPQSAEPVRAYRGLMLTAVLSFLAVILLFALPAIPYAGTVQLGWQWDALWRDGLLKQISGFSLLGLTLVVLVLSLRKRIKGFSWGDFAVWRLVHAAVGGAVIAAMVVHTGLRLGHNLNAYLMLSFLGLLLVGTGAAGVIAMEHRLGATLARRLRSTSVWLHILLFWPVPVLLGFHVLKTYFF